MKIKEPVIKLTVSLTTLVGKYVVSACDLQTVLSTPLCGQDCAALCNRGIMLYKVLLELDLKTYSYSHFCQSSRNLFIASLLLLWRILLLEIAQFFQFSRCATGENVFTMGVMPSFDGHMTLLATLPTVHPCNPCQPAESAHPMHLKVTVCVTIGDSNLYMSHGWISSLSLAESGGVSGITVMQVVDSSSLRLHIIV